MEVLKENGDSQLTIQNIQPPVRRKQMASTKGKKKSTPRPKGKNEDIRSLNIRPIYGKDRKLQANLKRTDSKYESAVQWSKDAEILLDHRGGFLEPENELERTYKVRQDEIGKSVGIQEARKAIDLKLDLGPYVADYTRNGRQLLLAGRKGHIATCDWRSGKPGCEVHVNETIRDAKWLHNNQYFAVAQKRYTYIYDHAGVEIHCLKQYVEASHLTFLPYHFLLAGIEISGFLRYTDTSTGQIVAQHPTRKGAPTSLSQNPSNAILHVGHQNGMVSLWSPNISTPLVKIQAHAGPVRAAVIDRSGHYMLSGGQDLRLKLWDIRMFNEVHSYRTYRPASTISISDRGLAAVGAGTSVTIWKDIFTPNLSTSRSADASEVSPSVPTPSSMTARATRPTKLGAPTKVQSPYLTFRAKSTPIPTISHLTFCPYEDILGLGHSSGFTHMLVPGAGEPNFDALEANPYETTKQRQEGEVKALLEKLQPDTIALDPDFVGNLDSRSSEQRHRDRIRYGDGDNDNDNDNDAGHRDEKSHLEALRRKDAGKTARQKRNSSAVKRYLQRKGKGNNIIDERRLRVMDAVKRERIRRQKVEAMQKAKREGGDDDGEESLGPALARFIKSDGL